MHLTSAVKKHHLIAMVTPLNAPQHHTMLSSQQSSSALRRGSTVANLVTLTENVATTLAKDLAESKPAKGSPANVEVDDGGDDEDDDEDEGKDDQDVESTKRLSDKQMLAILRGKLARRNKILEVVRRAYYHDVIVVKEEIRHARLQPQQQLLGFHGNTLHSQHSGSGVGNHSSVIYTSMSSARSTASNSQHSVRPPQPDDRLAGIPSVDLRDVLTLFAPSETVLQVHPCETCGGHLELVHGESKELMAARQEMARATKSELQMKGIVHRLRTEAKEMEGVNEALQQRVKALVKENSYTLEQLQASRKMERDQKTLISSLRAKLQLAQTTQEDLENITNEYKEVKQQLIRSNHDRDIFSASNNHLKEELAEIRKTLHQTKVDKAQLESDYGSAYYKLQEELKTCKQLREDLASERSALKDKTKLSDELLQSLTAVKDELSTAMQQFALTKRQLEDQLADEEKAREEAQEQSLEFRKVNKRLLRDLEQLQRDPLGLASTNSDKHSAGGSKSGGSAGARGGVNSAGGAGVEPGGSGNGVVDMKHMIRKRIEDTKVGLEHALMREHDLMGQLMRQKDASAPTAVTAGATKPHPMRKKLSRMPSTTIITRFAIPDTPSPAAAADASAGSGSAATSARTGGDTRPPSAKPGWQAGQIAEGDGGEGGTVNEIDEKAFEAYHQELHHLMLEVEDGKDKSQKQQKVISDLERKNQALLDRLEESKLAIETLTGSVGALKARLNQDSAGAAEHLEDMMRQIEEGKRDQLYENERGLILLHFMRTISNYAYELCDNQTLLVEFDLDRPPADDSYDDSDSLLSPELLQRKRELRKKVLMDRAMKKFSQQCHQRAEMVALELKKLVDNVDRLRTDLDEAEHKIDSDEQQIRMLDAEVSKFQLMVEVAKTNLARSDRMLKQATEELQDTLTKCATQTEELKIVQAEHKEMKDDTARLTSMLFEKTKAWEREINTNDKYTKQITQLELSIREVTTERDRLAATLQEIEDLALWKRNTNVHVGIMAAPDVAEMEMQTDRWKPQGLILRQRNDPQKMPQRYLGTSAVTIACGPELMVPDQSSGPLSPLGHLIDQGASNQSPRPVTAASGQWAESDEHVRDLLAMDRIATTTKGGTRLSKTSQSNARPRNLSRLFLSSDGVSQKYIAPARRTVGAGGADSSSRPSTTL